jgi:hypothetical protein
MDSPGFLTLLSGSRFFSPFSPFHQSPTVVLCSPSFQTSSDGEENEISPKKKQQKAMPEERKKVVIGFKFDDFFCVGDFALNKCCLLS